MSFVSKLIQAETTFGLLVGSIELFPECQNYADFIVNSALGKKGLGTVDRPKLLAETALKVKPEMYMLISLFAGENLILKKADLPTLQSALTALKANNSLPDVQRFLTNIIFFINRYGRVKFNNVGVLHKDYIGFNVYTINQMY